MDHFSKFHVLFPLQRKTAEEVSRLLEERVLAYFGPPKIFHSDNGREFVNQLIRAMFDRWGGDVTFINGRPRHSQSQGLVERGNRTVEQKIAAMKYDEGITGDHYPWAAWLPRIMFAINSQQQGTIKDSPYRVVFGKPPPTGIFPGAANICDEESMGPIQESSESVQTKTRPIPAPRKCPSATICDDQPSATICDGADELAYSVSRSPSLEPQSATSTGPASSSSPPQSPVTPQLVTPPRPSSTRSPSPPPQPVTPPEPAPPSPSPAGPASTKLPSSPVTRHTTIRKRALDNTFAAAASMSTYYNRRNRIRVQSFSVGDRVSICVPKLDRTSTDLPRIPCQVIKVHGEKQVSYTLATRHGTLQGTYRAGDIQTYSGSVEITEDPIISLREAAMKFHPENRYTKTSCKCSGGCKTNRCSCRQQGIECSTHCHSSSACANKTSNISKTPTSHTLKPADLRILKKDSAWLTDNHLNFANNLLKAQYPHIEGLQDTLLQHNLSFTLPTSDFVQFLHVHDNHWITLSNIEDDKNTVSIYDSLLQSPDHTVKQLVAAYLHTTEPTFTLNVRNVQHQSNTSDCGVFAIANATTLLDGERPTEKTYDQPRRHFQQCVTACELVPFPAATEYRQPSILHKITVPVYCSCRQPDDGSLMVECEACKEWFHGRCANITSKRAAKRWKCQKCQ